MPFLPNALGTAVNAASFAPQAEPDSVDFAALVAAYGGTLVQSGCAVSYGGSALQTAVASGVVYVAGTRTTVAGGTVTHGAADPTNPRHDLIVAAKTTGTVSITAGTAAADPPLPNIPANSILLASVYVPATATTLSSSNYVDKRITGNPIPDQTSQSGKVLTTDGTSPSWGTATYVLPYDTTGAADAGVVLQAAYDAGHRDITIPEGVFFANTPVFFDSTGVEKAIIRAHGVRFQAGTGLPTVAEFDSFCTARSLLTGCKWFLFNNTKRAALSAGVVTATSQFPTPSYNSRNPPNPRLIIEGAEWSGINLTNYNAGFVFGNVGGSTELNHVTMASARTLVSWTGYVDAGMKLNNCSAWGATNMTATNDAFLGYQIDSGDSCHILGPKVDNYIGIYRGYSCNGILINSTVGGYYVLEACHGVVILASHIEQATNISVTARIIYNVQDSDVTIIGSFDYMSESVASTGALYLNDSGGEGKHSKVEIVNWNARHWMAASDPSLGYAIYINKMAPASRIRVRSSGHTMSVVGTFATAYGRYGLSVSGNASNESTLAAAVATGRDIIGSGDFEIVKYSTSATTAGQNSPIAVVIRQIGNLGNTYVSRTHTTPTFFDSESYGTGTLTASTAYAYTAAVCNTLPDGTIQYGQAAAEWLQTSPGSGGALGFEMYCPTAAHGATLVVWRKTGTGVLATPDRYALIPIGSAHTRLLDTGANISKIAWITTSVPVPNTVAATNHTADAFYLNTSTVGGGAVAVPSGLSATGTPSSTTFLRGDGAWATPAGSGTNTADPLNPQWFEDFLSGNLVTNQIGALGWGFANGPTPTWLTPVANHPGIITISSGTTANTFSTLYLGLGSTQRVFLAADTWDVTFWVRPTQTDANTVMRIGLNANASATGGDGAYFEKAAADTDWFMVTTAGTPTRVDTTTAVAAATWYKMRVRRVNSTTIGFTLNASAEVTSTATPPALALLPYVNISSTTTTAKTIDVDACLIALTGLSR